MKGNRGEGQIVAAVATDKIVENDVYDRQLNLAGGRESLRRPGWESRTTVGPRPPRVALGYLGIYQQTRIS